jgi:2-furoate---CoA ligase
MNIGRVFERTVDRVPERAALVDPDGEVTYTYREWHDRAMAVANGLAAAGIDVNSRVATMMRNRAELATLYCATQLLGATFVPVNFRVSPDELAYLVNNTEPDLLAFSETNSGVVESARREFVETPMFVSADAEISFANSLDTYRTEVDGKFEPTFVDPTRTSLILHTGGTTGRPKSVPRTHQNTYAAATAHAIQASWPQHTTTLGLISLSHTMGIHTLASVILLGGKWVAQRRFSAEATAQAIESETIDSLYFSPTVFHDLLESDAINEADLSSVDRLAFAGANMSSADARALVETIDPDTFINHYGSTEVYTHSVCEMTDGKPSCAGRAGINARIRVVEPRELDDSDPTATVAGDALGEVIVDASSPEAFDVYLSSDDTGTSIIDGWFFTGDLGYRDEDGDLFVVGRVDDMIISGGENIYPIEIETVLEHHNQISETAVVGRPSERWNQTVAAFVTFEGESEMIDFPTIAAELDEYCLKSESLADFKRPRKYLFVDELVKSNVGKMLRKELQKRRLDINVQAEVDI